MNDILYVKFPDEIEQSVITIYNILGKVVLQKIITKTDFSEDLSSMASGLYMLRLNTKTSSKIFKFIKS